jgi:hypothetical protein
MKERSKEPYKKNHGTYGHRSAPHNTTDPKLHLDRSLKTIREYLAFVKQRKWRWRKRHAKNTIAQSATRTRNQAARDRAQELQGADRQDPVAPKAQS